MPLIPIDRLEDPRLDPFRDLKSRRGLPRPPQFVVEGLHVTERLLASPLETLAVLAERRLAERLLPQMSPATPLYVIPREMVESLVGFNFHRGVLGCARRPPSPALAALVPPHPAAITLAICIGIQDPENLGGIIRSGAALGIGAAVLGPLCADPFSRRVARTSMGASFRLPISEPQDLYDQLSALKKQSIQLVATVLDPAAQRLNEAAKPDRVALLFGSEGHGLEPRWIELCDQRVTIPMQPGVDSLNASVAAGIFLYSYRAPRLHAGQPPGG